MSKFMVHIKTYAVYVKAHNFFVEQGGLSQEWGQHWQKIEARDIEDARRRATKARDTMPGACKRTWPSRRNRKAHRVHWAGNHGICLNCGKGFFYSDRRVAAAIKKLSTSRHNFKAATKRNAKAFASTKSKDGQYPI